MKILRIVLVIILLTACNTGKEKATKQIKTKRKTEIISCIYDKSFIATAQNPSVYFFNEFSPNSWEKIKNAVNNKKLPEPSDIDLQNLYNHFVKNKPDFYTNIIPCPWNRKHLLAYITLKNKYDSVKIDLKDSKFIGYRIIGGNCSQLVLFKPVKLKKDKHYLLVLELIPAGAKVIPGYENEIQKSTNKNPTIYLFGENTQTKTISKRNKMAKLDYDILFLSAFTMRYRKVKFQEELKEQDLRKFLEKSDINNPEIKRYLTLLSLLEDETIGI